MLSRRVLLHQLPGGGVVAFQPVVLWILVLEDESRAFSILKTCKEWQKLQVGLKQQAPTFMCLYINHIQIYVHVRKTIEGTYESRRCCMASGLRLETTLFCLLRISASETWSSKLRRTVGCSPLHKAPGPRGCWIQNRGWKQSSAFGVRLDFMPCCYPVQGSICFMRLAVLHWGWGGCSLSLKALSCLVGLWRRQSLSCLCFSTSAFVPRVTRFFPDISIITPRASSHLIS